jgi:hypothetical protein
MVSLTYQEQWTAAAAATKVSFNLNQRRLYTILRIGLSSKVLRRESPGGNQNASIAKKNCVNNILVPVYIMQQHKWHQEHKQKQYISERSISRRSTNTSTIRDHQKAPAEEAGGIAQHLHQRAMGVNKMGRAVDSQSRRGDYILVSQSAVFWHLLSNLAK